MLLSVVVVNWNSIDDLRCCLQSTRAQSYQDLEVIVVDNGSTDGSAAMVRSEFPTCRLLCEQENLGFAEACNRGIAVCRGDWIAMLNNDAIADVDWAMRLVAAARNAPPDCGMLQSLLLYQSRADIINSTGIELTRTGGGRDRHEGKARSEACESDEIFCPTAGAAAYRRTMLDAIRISDGYFARSHFMYYEDMDLGWRARLAGFSAVYVPTSIVHHKWHGSTERRGRSWLLAIGATNRIRTILKNASPVFVLRTMRWSLGCVFTVLRHGGVGGAWTLLRAILESLTIRAEVERIRKVSRRDTEVRWQAKPL